jgi:glutathione S-transferase
VTLRRVLRLYRFRYSTNVDRVALALAHKGLTVESVWIDPDDRSPVEQISGQPLVPVLVDDDLVVADSTAIVEHLERTRPDPPLFPGDRAQAAGVRIFVDWFNRVWKREPNLLADALDAGRRADDPELVEWSQAIRARLQWLDALLAEKAHLFGEQFTAADVSAWPFLRYALGRDGDDTETFHRVIADEQPLDGHDNLRRYLERVRDERWTGAADRI